MTAFEPIVNGSLHTEVTNSIITAIALGQLRPGEKIIEQNIAEQMKISRAPVREALRELATQGIIEYTPRKGVTVAALDVQSIREAYSLRACLEGMAVNLAVDRLSARDIKHLENLSKKMTKYLEQNDIDNFIRCDVEFHTLISTNSGHLKLEKLLQNLLLQTRLYMLMSKYNLLINSRLDLEYGVHDGIIREIQNKDKAGAEAEMKKHIHNSGENLIFFLQNKKQG